MLKGFPWRFALYFVAAVYLFADLYVYRGPLHTKLLAGGPSWQAEGAGGVAAEVYGRPVTGLEVSEALRAHLWSGNEAWEAMGESAKKLTRRTVLETLVNERIVHAFRVMNGIDGERPVVAAERELATLKKQFEEAGDFDRRREGQGMSEADLKERVQAAVDDEAWIEEKIAHRLTDVTEAQARSWYEVHLESMRVPKVWRASHVFLSRHDPEKTGDRTLELEAVRGRIAGGELGFEAAAAEVSEDERTKLRGGDLGWFSESRMPGDFMAHVAALEPGKMTGVVETALGWHLIRLAAVKESEVPSFEAVHSEIRARLLTERREAALRSLMNELRTRSFRPTVFVRYHDEVIEALEPAP